MDSTELHYVNYDPEELWNRIHQTYLSEGGDILYPGNEKEILLRAVQAVCVAILGRVDNALRQATRKYAQDEFLDLYGEERGCPRIEATAATATVEITFRATGTAQTIEAGTELTADGIMLYHLTEDIEASGAAETIETTIECSEAGAAGNALANGTQMQFMQGNGAVLSVYATSNATGGQDREDEEAYRERIGTHGLTTNTTGPSGAYEAAAEAVSTLVLDAKALNDGDDEVGIYLVLEDGADSETILAEVEAALSPTTVRPLNDHVEAHLADEVEYILRPKVYYPSSANLDGTIDEAVEEYQDWQDHTIGRAFNPDKLTATLYQLGATRVQYAPGDGIDGGGAVYTEIAAREHCVGTITPELVVTT